MELQKIRIHTPTGSPRPEAIPRTVTLDHVRHDDQSGPRPPSDDDLVQAARSGDHEAFAELCRRHAQTARQTIYGIVRHHEDAEDALQETLLRAYTNLGRFRQSCKFSTWMTAIGINAALTVIRKRKRRREMDTESVGPEEWAREIADQAPDPECCVRKGQMILLLRKELQALPPGLRRALSTYYHHDHSLEEAADSLGISVSAVKSRLSRGRGTLRSSFERKGLLGSYQ